MVKCSFCGSELRLGGGKMFIKKDGTAFYFCSNKCEKNQIAMNRKPLETKWTDAHHRLKETMLSAKGKEKK